MNKYFISELYPHARFSVGIWREDVETILNERGYKKIILDRGESLLKKINSYISVYRMVRKLPSDAVVFVHFPLRSRVIRFFMQLANKKKLRSIALIHDIEGLRNENNHLLEAELKWLQTFTAIIAQNDKMKMWLEKKVKANIINLEFHDALYGNRSVFRNESKSRNICFAGNLQKAGFVQKLGAVSSVHFHVYGSISGGRTAPNISFHGLVDPAELIYKMNGSFGLVWDGDELTTCSGPNGRYLIYNTPYKMTAYVLAGLPLIVWNQSAMAEWVRSKKTGIAVASLHGLEGAIDSISEEEFQEMKRNLLPFQEKLKQGFFLKEALHKAEALLGS